MTRAKLKLPPTVRVLPSAADAPVGGPAGGLGLDFEVVPEHFGSVGRAAWEHVALTLARDPVYLRELDRHALISYCEAIELREQARQALLADGVVIDGRSTHDRGRQVRHPSFQIWRECDARVERWSTQLGFTRLGRHRLGQVGGNDTLATEDNPFAYHGAPVNRGASS